MKISTLSINIIYWITTIGFAFSVIALFAIFFITISNPFKSDESNSNVISRSTTIGTDLPVKIKLSQKGTLTLNERIYNVNLGKADSQIIYKNPSNPITTITLSIITVTIIVFTYLLWIFRGFIENIKEGRIFTEKNIFQLKKISYWLLGLWIFRYLYFKFVYYYIVKNLEFEGVIFTSDFNNNYWMLLFALFIWVIAHVFGYGLTLKKENELTI